MAEHSSVKTRKKKKKGKFRKNKGLEQGLCDEELNFLSEQTGFTSQEITEWHK